VRGDRTIKTLHRAAFNSGRRNPLKPTFCVVDQGQLAA
jgi:hypothetical protein